MSKGQTRRLTKQHISSGGASGIFGEVWAQVHDQSVGRASVSVFEKLKAKISEVPIQIKASDQQTGDK